MLTLYLSMSHLHIDAYLMPQEHTHNTLLAAIHIKKQQYKTSIASSKYQISAQNDTFYLANN